MKENDNRIRIITTLLLGSFCLFIASSFRAAPDPSWDSIPGDLPKHTIPHHYTISILPDIEAKTFKGTESIDLEVRTPVSGGRAQCSEARALQCPPGRSGRSNSGHPDG